MYNLHSPYPLRDSSDVPEWQQELVIDAYYSDVVNENSLILFEILGIYMYIQQIFIHIYNHLSIYLPMSITS
jgi:hypothetical protein